MKGRGADIKGVGGRWVVVGSKYCRRLPTTDYRLPTQQGYTLLELIITMAILGIAARFMLPGIDDWQTKRSFRNLVAEVEQDIFGAREQAEALNTTTRLLTTRLGDSYTFTVFSSSVPTAVCNAAGVWNQVSTRTETYPTRFELTGAGVGNVCFYRDGTASGGVYTFQQKDGGTQYGNATIQVTVATGAPDVSGL